MRLVICAAAASAMMLGCAAGSSGLRSQSPQGGVLALDGDENQAMKDAMARMAQHCGADSWQVIKRETVRLDGGAEEMRLFYGCRSAASTAVTAPVAAPASGSAREAGGRSVVSYPRRQ
jgi:hypothetical protein